MKKIAVLLAALIFVACSTPKPNSTPPNDNANKANGASTPATVTAAAPASNVSSTTPKESEATAKLAAEIQQIHPDSDAATTANLAAEIQKLHSESVYFDYNEYSLKPEFRDVIEKHAANFKKLHKTSLTLEGNADERGSAAYNLALGEKRATAVKKVLVTLGIPKSKIKVVSYGNTKPKLDCHEEKCWKENRRVDFVFIQQ